MRVTGSWRSSFSPPGDGLIFCLSAHEKNPWGRRRTAFFLPTPSTVSSPAAPFVVSFPPPSFSITSVPFRDDREKNGESPPTERYRKMTCRPPLLTYFRQFSSKTSSAQKPLPFLAVGGCSLPPSPFGRCPTLRAFLPSLRKREGIVPTSLLNEKF